jgi:hypothetical protein
MARCSNCILPDSFPGIAFEDGLCSFCKDSAEDNDQKRVKGKEKLREALKSEGATKYDCIVPLSGGKDSSFILFYIVKELGLRPLALFVETDFQTDLSVKNVKNICRKLQVDLIITHPTGYRKKAVCEALRASACLKKFWTSGICSHCENILRSIVIKQTRKWGVRSVVWGSTDTEDTVTKYHTGWNTRKFRNEFGRRKNPLDMLGKIPDSARRFAYAPSSLIHLFRFWIYSVLLNFDLGIPGTLQKLNPFAQFAFSQKDIQVVYFFDYVAYDPFLQIEILKSEVGWEAPLNREMRFDCKLSCFANYDFLSQTGVTKSGFIMSTLVRKGLITREKAIEKEIAARGVLRMMCEETLRDLNKESANQIP